GGEVTIEWFNRYTTPTTQEVIPLMVGKFEEENPGIKVSYQNPGNGEGYIEAMLARIAGGNPPDVATLYEPPVEFAARGSLIEIDEFMKGAKTATPDAFYPNVLKSTQWQGKTYGLASSAGAGAIYMNVAMFKEKGISTDRGAFPKTWDELKALDKQFIVMENGEVKQAGFVPFVGNQWLYPAWSALNGGQLFDTASMTYKLDSDQNVEWLDYWVRWLDEQYGGDLEKLNAAGNWAGTYPDTAFNLGKAAMAAEGSWSSTDAEIPFEWEVAKFPVGPSGTKTATAFWPNWWVIPKGTKQPEAAFKFIEFVATTGWQIWYEYIMDTPSWKNFPPTVLTTKLVNATSRERAENVNQFFADYLNDAVEMWTSPVESFANETISAAVDQVLNKVASPRDALAEAQKLCQDKLNETLKG
ncbi:MAG TPA: extracellular solute-binding protein, partial [Roseiflexaceae bacterium]|nr:extracellular solute-binding protein [Roseiflexaceae bacterium]